MLGYDKNDIGKMTDAIESALIKVNADDPLWLSGDLRKALTFLQGLLAEGYFD